MRRPISHLLLLLLPAAAAPAQQHLTLDDLLNTISQPAGLLSPDGLTLATTDHGQILLTPAPNSSAPSRTIADPATPKTEISWSPDSRQIAFISQGDVWIAPATGNGPATRLTHDPAGPGDPRGATDHHPLWNPHSNWILFQSGRNGFNQLYTIRADGSAEHAVAATEIYTGADVISTRTTSPDHGDAVSSDRFDPEPAWSPDGTKILYTERSRAHFSGRLLFLSFNPATGAVQRPTTVYTAPNDPGGAWAVNTAAWLPDSHRIVAVLQQTGWDKLWLLPATGGEPQPITTGTGEDESPVVSPDGASIAFLSNRDLPEEHHIWIVPTTGGTPRRLTTLPGIEGSPQWSPDSHTILFTRGTATGSPAPFSARVGQPESAAALHPAAPSRYADLGITPEVAHFQGSDGLALAGILYKPANFQPGHRYPTVIWAHGGPEGQEILSLSPWSLFLADHGYVVLEPNFRGSTGYGERFRNSNVEDSGGGEIDDIAASVHYLVQAGIADPKRVAIGGGSHGGTVVANAVARYPDTFAAGIEMFGVVDRALFLRYTNRNSAIRWETKMGGTPEAKPAVYRKANVLLEVDRIKTPLLILHGEQDPQVPPQESQEFVAALRAAGKPFEYHTYPREGHGFQEPAHRRDAFERQLDFLARELAQEPSVPEQGAHVTASQNGSGRL